jgi:hypothetical protein
MVRFELVSRYAEQKVAEKLSKFDLRVLSGTRLRLSPVSGSLVQKATLVLCSSSRLNP